MNLITIAGFFVFWGFVVGTVASIIPVLWHARKRPARETLQSVGIRLVPVTAFVLLFAWFFRTRVSHYSSPEELDSWFQSRFGVHPWSDIHDVRATRKLGLGSEATWVRFKASRTTVEKLLKKFEPDGKWHPSGYDGGEDAPEWWTPERDGIDSFSSAGPWMGVSRDRTLVYIHERSF